MSELIHVRPSDQERPKAPTLHDQEITLEKPPETPRRDSGAWSVFGPALVVVGLIGMLFVGFRNGRAFNGGWMTMPLMMVVGMTMMFRRRSGQSQGSVAKRRADYARYLDGEREAALEVARTQFAVAEFHYPSPDVLAARIGSTRMWERGRGDGEHQKFGYVRIGLGVERSRRKYNQVELGALIDQEPACAQMVGDLIAEQSYVRDIPRSLSLVDHPAWLCGGDIDAARASVRAMVMHAAFFHGPQDLGVAVITSEDRAAVWDWVKWLPHHRDETKSKPMTYASAVDLVGSLGEAYSSRGMFKAAAVRRSSMAAAAGSMSAPGGSDQGAGRFLIVVCDNDFVDWPVLLRANQGGAESGVEGVCFLVVGGDAGPLRSAPTTLTFESQDRVLRPESERAVPELLAKPDQVELWSAEAFARRLAAWRPGSKASALLGARAGEAPALRLGSLIGIEDWADFDPEQTWLWAKNRRNFLRVPVGQFIDSGRPWFLDMKEDETAHGPHFGLGGKTGGGKSQFLRTHTLALVCTHSPQDLVLIPADFKGNSTFRGFEEIPHVLMVLNNLETSPDSVTRLIQVLMGELERRQRILDRAGDLAVAGVIDRVPANIMEYRALRAKRPDLNLEPMPHLYIPFDELMQAKRTFPELLSIMRITGTVGRSLGVHMAPVSQQLDDNLMAGIGTHLTSRIALKMNDPRDYRAVLGQSNPGALPDRKGVGYFVPNLDSPAQRVQVAYVSGTYRPPVSEAVVEERAAVATEARPRVLSAFKTPAVAAVERVFGSDADPKEAPEPVIEQDAAERELTDEVVADEDEEKDISSTDMGVAIAVLKAHGGRADHIPWLPELLSYRPVFDSVATYIRQLRPELAEHLLDWDAGHPGRYVKDLVTDLGSGPLTPVSPCGIIDKPREHAQDVLTIDLSANTALAGAQDAGKSFGLLSILTAAATLYSCERMQFFCIDNGGGELSWLENLNHVGAVISGDGDVYGIGRMVNHVQHIMNRRSASWSAARISTVDEWRARRFGGDAATAASVPDDGYGDVYLVINGFDKFLQAFPEHVPTIEAIGRSGPDRGVHLLVSANSWNTKGTFQLWENCFKSRYELRLDNPNDSLMTSSAAQSVPQFPGRGLITVSGASRARRGQVQVQGADAVPPEPIVWHVLYSAPEVVTAGGQRISVSTDAAAATTYINDLRPAARPVDRMPELPTQIRMSKILADFPAQTDTSKILLGLAETDAKPYYWSPADDANLAIVGSSESGRSTTLKLILHQLQRRIETAPEGQKPLVVVFDQSQALAGVAMDADYVYTASQIPRAVQKINTVLASRDTGEELTQAELVALRESGQRFQGPEVFVIIDNLTDFLSPADPFGWDTAIEKAKLIGFHVIVTRFADPSLTGAWMNRGMMFALKRANAPIMLMSASPELINVVGKLRGQILPAGRGLVIGRAASTMIQVAVPDDEPWLQIPAGTAAQG